ncbi:MAG: alpha/beta hydrolase [Clostridia bacterium]|nr:alpha/beta hydrolase [Clostridia bacterium]
MIFKYENLDINYEIFDERENKNDGAKPLLLLHGWMAKIEAMAPIYLHYKKSRPVYVLDFPGQAGKSSTLNSVWGVPEYSLMVKSFIENQKIEGCDVIGHSFGGRVIIYLSSQYKDLFGKIILTDAAGIKSKMTLKKFFRIYSYKLARNMSKIFLSKEKYEKKLEEMRKKRGSSDYAQLSSDTMRETFKSVINLDLKNRLKDIANSTLLIWGENDQDTPLYMAKIMEKEIKDSGLVVIENAGHFSYLDNTNKYLLVADNFLNN